MNNRISESIFSNEKVIVPMADIQHIEKLKRDGESNGLWLITKQTNWDYEMDMWNNPIYITEEDSKGFIDAWYFYRHKKDIK